MLSTEDINLKRIVVDVNVCLFVTPLPLPLSCLLDKHVDMGWQNHELWILGGFSFTHGSSWLHRIWPPCLLSPLMSFNSVTASKTAIRCSTHYPPYVAHSFISVHCSLDDGCDDDCCTDHADRIVILTDSVNHIGTYLLWVWLICVVWLRWVLINWTRIQSYHFDCNIVKCGMSKITFAVLPNTKPRSFMFL